MVPRTDVDAVKCVAMGVSCTTSLAIAWFNIIIKRQWANSNGHMAIDAVVAINAHVCSWLEHRRLQLQARVRTQA